MLSIAHEQLKLLSCTFISLTFVRVCFEQLSWSEEHYLAAPGSRFKQFSWSEEHHFAAPGSGLSGDHSAFSLKSPHPSEQCSLQIRKVKILILRIKKIGIWTVVLTRIIPIFQFWCSGEKFKSDISSQNSLNLFFLQNHLFLPILFSKGRIG